MKEVALCFSIAGFNETRNLSEDRRLTYTSGSASSEDKTKTVTFEKLWRLVSGFSVWNLG